MYLILWKLFRCFVLKLRFVRFTYQGDIYIRAYQVHIKARTAMHFTHFISLHLPPSVFIWMCPHACILTLPGAYISLIQHSVAEYIFWIGKHYSFSPHDTKKSFFIKQKPRASVHLCNNVNHCVSKGNRWKTLATRL